MNQDIDVASLGSAIKRLRSQRNWTAYRLAQKASVSAVYVRDLEEGKAKRPGIVIVAKLAHALGRTTDELLAESGVPVGAAESEGLFVPDLNARERSAVLRIADIIRELRPGHDDQHAPVVGWPRAVEDLKGTPRAAYSKREMADKAIRDAEEWPET